MCNSCSHWRSINLALPPCQDLRLSSRRNVLASSASKWLFIAQQKPLPSYIQQEMLCARLYVYAFIFCALLLTFAGATLRFRRGAILSIVLPPQSPHSATRFCRTCIEISRTIYPYWSVGVPELRTARVACAFFVPRHFVAKR